MVKYMAEKVNLDALIPREDLEKPKREFSALPSGSDG